jgi:hypothetical protein
MLKSTADFDPTEMAMNIRAVAVVMATLALTKVAVADEAPASEPAVTAATGAPALADGAIAIGTTAPYVDTSMIAQNILDECALPQSQMKSLLEHATKAGVSLVTNEEAVTAKSGKVLVVETTMALSQGNAWRGHAKLVAIRGRLFDNGTEIGNFSARRNSMGGVAAGFMSSCAVLYRCQNALARDVLEWLKNPVKDARLGD